jgi:hypothetical protein
MLSDVMASCPVTDLPLAGLRMTCAEIIFSFFGDMANQL